MIIQSLQKLTATGEELYAKVCTVHRVDQANKCCDVIPVDGTAELFDVSFGADAQVDGLCFYPAVDSHVLVVFTGKHHACICQVSEVDMMKLVINQTQFSVDKDQVVLENEGTTFSIDKDGFVLKKENETLKKLMEDLLKAIQAMVFVTPPAGPTSGVTIALSNAADFAAIQTRFNNLLKDA